MNKYAWAAVASLAVALFLVLAFAGACFLFGTIAVPASEHFDIKITLFVGYTITSFGYLASKLIGATIYTYSWWVKNYK